jgi:hypothetical protein
MDDGFSRVRFIGGSIGKDRGDVEKKGGRGGDIYIYILSRVGG